MLFLDLEVQADRYEEMQALFEIDHNNQFILDNIEDIRTGKDIVELIDGFPYADMYDEVITAIHWAWNRVDTYCPDCWYPCLANRNFEICPVCQETVR